jgi:tRNA(Arg) A34 adenosine deaminase TadA
MCLGAIYWARPDRVVYAASHQDAAALAGFDDQFIYEELALPPAKRKIRMTQHIREEGLVPFFKWKVKQDREEY